MDLSRGGLDFSNGQRYVLDGSEIPFPDLDSILALLPGYARGESAGSMRDALLNTIRAIANKIWADTGLELHAFVSPRYAWGAMLDVWGVILQKPRLPNEEHASYRARLLTVDAGITPNAIKAAVLAVAAFSLTKPVFQEPADDAIWLEDDAETEVWCSFWQPDAGRYWNYDPTSPNPTAGAYLTPDGYGAQFWIIMQLGAGADDQAPILLADDDVTTVDANSFIADGTVDWGFWSFDGDPLDLRIYAETEARKAFGVAWMLIEDPYLGVAI